MEAVRILKACFGRCWYADRYVELHDLDDNDKVDKHTVDATVPLTHYPRPKKGDLYPELARSRLLGLINAMVTAGRDTRFVLFRYGTIFICPPNVEDTEKTARKLLKRVSPVGEVSFVAQSQDQKLFVFMFGKIQGYQALLVAIDPEPLQLQGVPHQHLQEVARMFLMWDREDRIVVESGAVT